MARLGLGARSIARAWLAEAGARGRNVSAGWRAHLGRRLAVVSVCARDWRVRINKNSVINCGTIHFPIGCPVVLSIGLVEDGA